MTICGHGSISVMASDARNLMRLERVKEMLMEVVAMHRAVLSCWILCCIGQVHAADMPWIAIAKDKKGFVLEPTGKKFTPWGFNYDRDHRGRLIEDYWQDEWPTVETHFGQMKKLGCPSGGPRS
jgi:hypothetical protein